MVFLEQCGLKKIGEWVLSSHASVAHLREKGTSGINYRIPQEWRKRRDVTYAFVFGDIVRYIGETSAGMASRFNGYRYGNPAIGDTDNRVKKAITAALLESKTVSIWGAQPSTQITVAGVAVPVPASKPLEEYLIAHIDPDLNHKNLGAKPTPSISGSA